MAEDGLDPLLCGIIVLSGDQALILNDMGLELVCLFEFSANLLELLLNHKGKGTLQLELFFLFQSLAGNTLSALPRLTLFSLDVEAGGETVTDCSNEALATRIDFLDNLVDGVLVG